MLALTSYSSFPGFSFSSVSHFLSSCNMPDSQHNLSPPSTSFSSLPLTPESIGLAHTLIKTYVHRTPLLTCQTLNNIASIPRHPGAASPKIDLYFKCENYQKIGAFKARGAFHAVIQLIEKLGLDEVRRKGVVTHSSGTVFPIFPVHQFQTPLTQASYSQETMPKPSP